MKPQSRTTVYVKAVVILFAALYFVRCIRTPDDYHFIAGVNLIFHEAGHIIFIFFGEFLHVLGGSLTQVLIPLVCATYFFLRKDFFSVGLLLMWTGESLAEVAYYAADAVAMQLPLLGGDTVIHDWNWLLTTTHTLQYSGQISGAILFTGWLAFLGGIVVSLASLTKVK